MPKISLVVRCIRNFEYRTVKNLVLHDIDTSCTVRELKQICLERIQTDETFARFRTVSFDTVKKYTTFQGYKPNNLIINIDNDDEWILKDDTTLADARLESEGEVSFFNRTDYLKYKENPIIKWE